MPNMRRHRKDTPVKKATPPKTVHGIRAHGITHKEPGNGLPKWVKEAAAARGYGDSLDALSLFVTQDDINAAFDCVAHGNGAKCVMAQAGHRLGAKSVYFYRTTAWVDFGTGPILRFTTPNSIYKNIITPFDKGDRESVTAGVYPLTPPRPSRTLESRRKRNARRGEKKAAAGKDVRRNVIAHTDRVVMAAQSA